MARAKIMDHPIAHGDVENEDRIIFLVVGVVVTVLVFIVMKVFEM
jgi:hypothetical protein